MAQLEPNILALKEIQTLTILRNIVEDEGNPSVTSKPDFPTVGYPVLIGSRAAKWHIPSFREPKDWDLIATASQSILFISLVTITKELKLTHYTGVGLKINGECEFVKSSINFEIELVSDKVNLKEILTEGTNGDVNEIKFKKFENDQEREKSKTSSQMIWEMCRDLKDKLMFPPSSFPFVVAPLKVLEALKSSHIYWSNDFYKHIADLHSLRTLLNYNNQVPMDQPLLSPPRDDQTKLMLKTRIKETEMIKGVPGAHINLNKTNEEFLDREDDLFVQRRVPHDELHERVKYGDRPIYETLKEDKSKAWIKKSLFQQIDYQTQLNCVKEEAMAIALERYLIPMISKDQEYSYSSALARICTSLTKGWFRQFAIDNYPRLSNLDKDLLSIAQNIIDNHPLAKKNQTVPSILLHEWIPDLEIRAIFEPIYSCTEKISSLKDIKEPSYSVEFSSERSGIKITSPVNEEKSITAVITTAWWTDIDSCTPGSRWWASIAIVPSKDIEELDSSSENSNDDPLNLHPFDQDGEATAVSSKHIFTLQVIAQTSGGSWGGEDIWQTPEIYSGSADQIANELEIPGFTGDLLLRYVLAYLQPSFESNGEVPLKHRIDALKADGAIPIKPPQHLWYDTWKYFLVNGSIGDRRNRRYLSFPTQTISQ